MDQAENIVTINLQTLEMRVTCNGVTHVLRSLDPQSPADLICHTMIEGNQQTTIEGNAAMIKRRTACDVVQWLAWGFKGIPKRFLKAAKEKTCLV